MLQVTALNYSSGGGGQALTSILVRDVCTGNQCYIFTCPEEQIGMVICLINALTTLSYCLAKWRLGAWGIQELPLLAASSYM